MLPDVTVFDQILRIAALVERDTARSLAPAGLTTARMHLLWVIHHAGPMTQQKLAAALAVTPRNVTGLVDALVESGLVTREPHPTDRRAVEVTLTAAGNRITSAAARDHASVAEDLLSAVPAADRAAFERGLAAVVDRLDALVAEGRWP